MLVNFSQKHQRSEVNFSADFLLNLKFPFECYLYNNFSCYQKTQKLAIEEITESICKTESRRVSNINTVFGSFRTEDNDHGILKSVFIQLMEATE